MTVKLGEHMARLGVGFSDISVVNLATDGLVPGKNIVLALSSLRPGEEPQRIFCSSQGDWNTVYPYTKLDARNFDEIRKDPSAMVSEFLESQKGVKLWVNYTPGFMGRFLSLMPFEGMAQWLSLPCLDLQAIMTHLMRDEPVTARGLKIEAVRCMTKLDKVYSDGVSRGWFPETLAEDSGPVLMLNARKMSLMLFRAWEHLRVV